MKQTKILAVILATAGALAATTAMAKPGCGGMGAKMSFEELDADGNGEISKAEMEAHKAARFSTADGNGDGKLSAEELVAQAQKHAAKRVEKMISHLDSDGDGMLSAEEMSNRGGRHGDMFKRVDRDGNGAVSKEEFEQAREHRGGKRRNGHGGPDGDCGGRGGKMEQN
ncbi:MAG: calcium-binding protein [Roseobacter sp. MedPE-SW]|nr:MAG: calcium-binding protein [Roseobacter sp. MedPE-SW]